MQITIKLSDQKTIIFQGAVLFKETKTVGCAAFEVTGYESHEVQGGFSLRLKEKTPCYERTEMMYFETFGRFVLGTQAIMGILDEIPQHNDTQLMSCEHCGWGGPTQ